MSSTQQFSITLPDDIAQMLKEKVLSGEYASESDVVLDGLYALKGHEDSFEAWLWAEVSPAYDRLKANPNSALSLDQVRQHLVAKRKQSL